MLILYVHSVYVPHKNNSRNKQTKLNEAKPNQNKPKKQTAKLHNRPTVATSLPSEKNPQFLRMRYKTHRELGLQPSVASQLILLPHTEHLKQSNLQYFLNVKQSLLTGFNALASPATKGASPFQAACLTRSHPWRTDTGLIHQCILSTQHRDLICSHHSKCV